MLSLTSIGKESFKPIKITPIACKLLYILSKEEILNQPHCQIKVKSLTFKNKRFLLFFILSLCDKL